jgi:hypothetical protein
MISMTREKEMQAEELKHQSDAESGFREIHQGGFCECKLMHAVDSQLGLTL